MDEVEIAAAHLAQGEVAGGLAEPVLTHSEKLIRTADEAGDAGCEVVGGIGWEEETVLSVVNNVTGHPGKVRGNGYAAAGHGFGENQAKAFIVGGKDKEVT
jgi:hypothetical protein